MEGETSAGGVSLTTELELSAESSADAKTSSEDGKTGKRQIVVVVRMTMMKRKIFIRIIIMTMMTILVLLMVMMTVTMMMKTTTWFLRTGRCSDGLRRGATLPLYARVVVFTWLGVVVVGA